jgi:hypothetical protein
VKARRPDPKIIAEICRAVLKDRSDLTGEVVGCRNPAFYEHVIELCEIAMAPFVTTGRLGGIRSGAVRRRKSRRGREGK